MRAGVIWTVLAVAICGPLALAANSPLLAWRDTVYIASGFAGVIAMSVLLLQPLLVGGYVPGLPAIRGRNVHRWMGALLVVAVIVHVVGLWITSPPDVIDALTFDSPTLFSIWGVIAMWAIFCTALLALLRRRMRLRLWRIGHTCLALVIVMGTILHAMLIEGTMETLSKTALCALILLATLKAVIERRAFSIRRK